MTARSSPGKKKLVSTRERAKALILAGRVQVDGEVVDKPGRLVDEICSLQVQEDLHPYASRGGLKLEHALDTFNISPAGKIAADIGASTGGFTDCLLQHGVEKVFAVDVGYGQLDWKLRSDSRVICLDRKNARHLSRNDINTPLDLAVVDVSFISLKLIIPPLLKLLKPAGDLVALVKPQFEVGRAEVEHKGIIKDPEKHLKVLLDLRTFMEQQGWPPVNLTPSPITGQKGNREFFIHLIGKHRGDPVGEEEIDRVVFG